jgi:hypothetical protein
VFPMKNELNFYILRHKDLLLSSDSVNSGLLGNSHNIYAHNDRETVFSVGPCRGLISKTKFRGLNLAVVKLTTVQVTKLLL